MSLLGVTPLIDRLHLSIVIEDQSQMQLLNEGKEMRTLVFQETSQTSRLQSRWGSSRTSFSRSEERIL